MVTSSTRGQSVKRDALLQQWATPITRAIFSLMLAAAASSATAMGLGAIHVRSNLGEPLSAEIDVTALTEAEANGLKASLAAPAQYAAAGLEMSTSLQGAAVTLQRRADGRPYLRISGSRPVNDPFVDLVIETDNSESGRAVRGYTILIDPPPAVYTVPKLTPPVIASRREPVVAPPVVTRPVVEPQASAEVKEAPATPERKTAKRPAAEETAAGDNLRVRRGETAGALARRYASQEGVSFDQMLAALLRNNPDAFIGGNVNLLKAGAVIQVPTSADASAVSSAQAKKEWAAHGRNFQEYRRKLAKVASKRVDANAERSASGAIDTQISDETRAAKARDKLMLGKGKTKANVDKELRQRSDKESQTRVAELSKNIAELSKLSSATGAAGSKATAGVKVPVTLPATKVEPVKAPTAVAANKTTALAAPQLVAKPTDASHAAATVSPTASPAAAIAASAVAAAVHASSAASAAVAAVQPASVASAAAAAASSVASAASAAVSAVDQAVAPAMPSSKVLAQQPAAEPSMTDKMGDYALPLAGLLAVLGLGGGLAWFMRRRKRQGEGLDSADFLESKLQADSFFDASGGQRIDTASRSTEGASSSMVYSPSQLDAAGDVDPVAEAGVYMAYNRDQQAEDILKEAMRITPSRVAIYTTLMDIYGKRGDLKAFDVVAKEAYHLTQGKGDEWAKAVALGMEYDPKNSMYGALSPRAEATDSSPAPAFDAEEVSRPHAAATSPMPLEQTPPKIEAADLDIAFRDSEFKIVPPQKEQAAPAFDMSATTMPMRIAPTPVQEPAAEPSMDLEFEDVTRASDLTTNTGSDALFTEEGLSNSGRAPLSQAAPAPTFDLGDLSLDLDGDVAPVVSAAAPAPAVSDPWMTKLELAREFAALGDNEGARGLAEEVVANAPDAIANQARTFIATMI